jgi:hypothetical protein
VLEVQAPPVFIKRGHSCPRSYVFMFVLLKGRATQPGGVSLSEIERSPVNPLLGAGSSSLPYPQQGGVSLSEIGRSPVNPLLRAGSFVFLWVVSSSSLFLARSYPRLPCFLRGPILVFLDFREVLSSFFLVFYNVLSLSSLFLARSYPRSSLFFFYEVLCLSSLFFTRSFPRLPCF